MQGPLGIEAMEARLQNFQAAAANTQHLIDAGKQAPLCVVDSGEIQLTCYAWPQMDQMLAQQGEAPLGLVQPPLGMGQVKAPGEQIEAHMTTGLRRTPR